jgi:hypothetical protein
VSILAYVVYGIGKHVEIGLHGVWRRCACLYWPTWCMEKVCVSILAYMVYGEGGRVYVGQPPHVVPCVLSILHLSRKI